MSEVSDVVLNTAMQAYWRHEGTGWALPHKEGMRAAIGAVISELVSGMGRVEAENARLRGELEALRLGPIEQSDGLVTGRDYIPLPGGWELQTKGTGSTFRIVDTKSGDRLAVPDSPYLHETLERMAREIHGALVRIDGEKA